MTQQELFQEELLESIENIEEAKWQAEFDVYTALNAEYLKAWDLYCEYDSDDSILFMESKGIKPTDPRGATNHRTIWRKIVIFIKRVVAWIVKQFTRLKDWILKMAGKKKKSVDQLLDRLQVSPLYHSADLEEIIEIPSDEASEVQMEAVKIAAKPLFAEFEDDGSVKFTIKELKSTKKTPISGQDAAWRHDGTNTLLLMQHPELLQQLTEIIMSVREIITNNQIDNDIAVRLKKWMSVYHKKDIPKSAKFSQQQIQDFSVQLNKLSDEVLAIDIPETFTEFNKDTNNALHEISRICNSLQMGLNMLTGSMKKIYVVDLRYRQQLNNVAVLDQFIYEMISNGIPPKYVRFNAFVISHPEITNGQQKPVWGQSRFIFFPEKTDHILKCAISGMGIRGNKVEAKVTEAFEAKGGGKYLARVLKSEATGSIIHGEKVKVKSGLRYYKRARALESKVNKFIEKHGIPFLIRDVHDRNIGFRKNGDIVIIDYGFTIPRKAPKNKFGFDEDAMKEFDEAPFPGGG